MPEQNNRRCCDNCISFMEVLEEFREQYGCDGYCMFRVSLSDAKKLDDQFKRKSTDTCADHMWSKSWTLIKNDEVTT